MHNAAFRRLRLDYLYLPFDVDPSRVAQAVEAIRALGLAGVNVTVPHKERVIPHLDRLTPQARAIGAVNTIVNRGGRLVGHNTDGAGFLAALRTRWGCNVRGRSVCLLGAGGSARAVAVALLGAGVKRLVIANRTAARGTMLAARLRRQFPGSSSTVRGLALSSDALDRAAAGCDLLVNATSAGMQRGDPRLLGPALVRRFPAVCDLIYAPPETRLLKDARAAGCRTMNGLPMLVYQGALSFELWTGRKAPIDVMFRAVRATRQD
jgi:shikimate dehydrogenase